MLVWVNLLFYLHQAVHNTHKGRPSKGPVKAYHSKKTKKDKHIPKRFLVQYLIAGNRMSTQNLWPFKVQRRLVFILFSEHCLSYKPNTKIMTLFFRKSNMHLFQQNFLKCSSKCHNQSVKENIVQNTSKF